MKDIQINFGTQESAVKTVKTLPNTAVVSDRVEFAKTVKSHGIKGSVSFEYETTEVTPAEPVKPVDTTKPTEPAKPVEKPTTPVDTKPKDEPTTPTTPKEDNGTWKEETRTRIVTVDEEYTENTTEDVFEEKQLFDDWLYLANNGVRYQELGWYEDFTDDMLGDLQLKIFTEKGIKVSVQTERKVRETKKVKVGTKTVPVTKVRKVEKQETYTIWINSKTGEVRTERP